jgi:hypothetical protein
MDIQNKLTRSAAVTAGIAAAGLAVGAAAMGAVAIGAFAIGALEVSSGYVQKVVTAQFRREVAGD